MENRKRKLGERYVSLIYSKAEEDKLFQLGDRQTLNLPRSHVDYWLQKRNDNTFHQLEWGKHKNRKRVFNETELPQVFQAFLDLVKENPTVNVSHIRDMFSNTFNRPISETTTKRVLKHWGWTWKVPTFVQINKYSQDNMIYYAAYVEFLKRVDHRRLKFVDESHFVPKNLRSRKVIGMRNQRVWVPVSDLKEKHASISLITSLNTDLPVFF